MRSTHVMPMLQRKAADRMDDLLGCQDDEGGGDDAT